VFDVVTLTLGGPIELDIDVQGNKGSEVEFSILQGQTALIASLPSIIFHVS
jgi:hypothetical protein